MGHQVAGILLDKELTALGKITSNPEHPVVACIGGSKVRSVYVDLGGRERVKGGWFGRP